MRWLSFVLLFLLMSCGNSRIRLIKQESHVSRQPTYSHFKGSEKATNNNVFVNKETHIDLELTEKPEDLYDDVPHAKIENLNSIEFTDRSNDLYEPIKGVEPNFNKKVNVSFYILLIGIVLISLTYLIILFYPIIGLITYSISLASFISGIINLKSAYKKLESNKYEKDTLDKSHRRYLHSKRMKTALLILLTTIVGVAFLAVIIKGLEWTIEFTLNFPGSWWYG